MSGFGLFEANVTSDAEQKRQVREASNKLAAATYDVRERFGQFLFAARDLAEYNDRLALSKNDILKTIEPHVFPRTGTVRRVLKPLEREFKALRTADMGTSGPYGMDDDKPGALTPATSTPNPTQGAGIGGVGAGGGGMSTIQPAADLDKPSAPSGIGSMGGANDTFRPGGYPVTQSQIDSIGGSDAFEGPGKGLGSGSGTPDSPNDPQAFKDGGPGNETPSTDPIGPGEYTIQSGDTYSDLAQRAGWGDDYQGFADATGYQADNPDMIYAGDTINVVAPPGSDSTAGDAAAPAGDAPLAAEAGGASDLASQALNNDAAAANAPLSGDFNKGASRRAASRRRRADFERNLDTDETYTPSDKELKPEGDFKGWLDSVDQDAEGKVDRNFGGTFPGGTEHDGDPAKTDFAKSATRRFARWCKANRVTASLATLESYSPSDREYIAIAATLQRVAEAPAPASTGEGLSGMDLFNLNEIGYLGAPGGPSPSTAQQWINQGVTHPLGPHTGSRRSATPGVPGSKPKGPEWTSKGKPRNVNSKPDLGTVDDAPTANMPGGTAVTKVHAARRRIAAPDYLQKADEALTNLLNQKAEEFQQTIAPLQQALQTVQQAEAEAQAQNPLNVLPPAGTVNVLPQPPGGDPNGTDAGAGGGGMDPNALMALMGGGGGDPSMGGGDPAAGGGAPPGMDPAAMGGAPPAAAGQDALPPELMGGQQMQARRRGKARGANAPRTAKNVDQLWEEYTHQTTLRGGEPDVETFAQRYKVGPRALQRIRQKSMGG